MGRYRLGKPIGYGGMAVVFEAWRLFPDASSFPVALKRILPQYCGDAEFAQLLHREARVCMQLRHPNLVAVYDFDCDEDGQLFLVMERVDGVTVSAASSLEELEYPTIRRILRDVLRALAYVHDREVVHRDISPCNILLSRTGEVKLSDFGLARSAMDGVRSGFGFKGKAAYASPEAIQCAELGPSADLYSLASVLYQLITGKPPFDYGHVMQINRRMSEWHIAPLGDEVPEDLRALAMGMLRYTPEERTCASAEEMLAEIERLGQPVADCADVAALVARTAKESLLVAGKRSEDAQAAAVGERNIDIQSVIQPSPGRAGPHGTEGGWAQRPPRLARWPIFVRTMLAIGTFAVVLGAMAWAYLHGAQPVRLAPAAGMPQPAAHTSQESDPASTAVHEPGPSRPAVDTAADQPEEAREPAPRAPAAAPSAAPVTAKRAAARSRRPGAGAGADAGAHPGGTRGPAAMTKITAVGQHEDIPLSIPSLDGAAATDGSDSTSSQSSEDIP